MQGKKETQCTTEIDFVITWVDGSDEEWLAEKRRWSPENGEDDRKERYRDWGLLKYWFRGVEKYAPWVRKIHFVTWGHLPKWLDTSNPKLHVVKHTDFIPAEYLPTYNSCAIEWNLHRIPGLSEQFVYFNDDMFPVRQLLPEDFFIGGKPCDMLAFQPVVANPTCPVMSYQYLNNSIALSRHFDKRTNVRKQPGKYFHIGYPPIYFLYNLMELKFPRYTGFYTVHGPFPLCRERFDEVWKIEREAVERTCSHKFRSNEDVTPYLVREWQKLSGEFVPRNVQKLCGYYNVESSNPKLVKAITKQQYGVVCINDANKEIDMKAARRELNRAFHTILPEKSTFELPAVGDV
jgi:hypothetical protein